jgi:hypothetical protein
MFRIAPFLIIAVCCAVNTAWSQDAVELTGTVGCAKCDFNIDPKPTECAAMLKVDAKLYYLKTADDAPKALKEMLKKIAAGTLKGDYVAKGVESTDDSKKDWLTVTSLTPKPAAKKDNNKKHGGKKN